MSAAETQSSSSLSGERIAWGRLWLMGLFAIVAAVVVNVLVDVLALSLLPIPAMFMALRSPIYIIYTVIGAVGAVLVFALIARFSRRPIRLFHIVALIVLVISFGPDLWLLTMPFASGVGVGVLIAMHITTYAVMVGVLTTTTRAK
jgi:hypothetical protein